MRFMVALNRKANVKLEELMAHVPAEQAHIAKLTQQGIIEATYVAQNNAWVVLKADSAEKVEQLLQAFPLRPYLDSVITPLV
jgi:muconolactone delta-isomerase